jgi:hypothetical protein
MRNRERKPASAILARMLGRSKPRDDIAVLVVTFEPTPTAPIGNATRGAAPVFVER